MKAFVVLNPAAGQQAHESVRDALGRHFVASRIQYQVHATTKQDKPAEIVREFLRGGCDLAVAAGGDGTVSNVIDGLAGSRIPLGIIPTGTANLIARELGIPTAIDDAVGLIAGTPRSRLIDAMRVGNRVFVLNVSVGISAAVINDTKRRHKTRFGRIAYLWTTMPKLFSFRPRHLVVSVDGIAQEYRAIEVAVLNCGLLAKMLYPQGHEIRLDDGRLDVVVVGLTTIRELPRYVVGIVTRGSAAPLSRVIPAEQRVTIRSNVPLQVQADGDIIGTTPVAIEVLPHAVTVLVPPAAVSGAVGAVR